MPAIVHFAKDGGVRYAATDGVDMYIIDETSPHDRVYRVSTTITADELAALIGSDDVGHAGDARHAAISARVREYIGGATRLTTVDPEK